MSDRQPEEDENLLNFIAATVEMIREKIQIPDRPALNVRARPGYYAN